MIAGGEQPCDLGRAHPVPVDFGQVLVGRPTGDGAALSDEDGDLMFAQLGQQLARRRHPETLQALRVVGDHRSVASPPRMIVVSCPTSTEPLAARCSGMRGARRISRSGAREVGDLHGRCSMSLMLTLADREPARQRIALLRQANGARAVTTGLGVQRPSSSRGAAYSAPRPREATLRHANRRALQPRERETLVASASGDCFDAWKAVGARRRFA